MSNRTAPLSAPCFAVTRDRDELDGVGDGQLTRQIGKKYERPLEHTDQHQNPLAPVFFVYFGRNLIDALLNRLLSY